MGLTQCMSDADVDEWWSNSVRPHTHPNDRSRVSVCPKRRQLTARLRSMSCSIAGGTGQDKMNCTPPRMPRVIRRFVALGLIPIRKGGKEVPVSPTTL